MERAFPKLRSDLEIRAESSEPGSPLIVKDPILRQFYRFAPIQAAVLRRLDGKQDPVSLAKGVSEKEKTDVTAAQVQDFVDKLRKLLLLDEPAVWSRLESFGRKRSGFLGSILSIKIRAVNPDALITRLERKLRFCFSGSFVALVSISIIIAVCISILNWESLVVSVGSLLELRSLALVMVCALGVLTAHEFAHGLTLKHFGGRVDEMGFLLLYFMPAFYCNVSDAWLLRKRERLWVTFAGGFVQLFIWSLAVVVWRLVSPETFPGRVCLAVIAFSGIQTLFNFNPLIRLDGYYFLSDYLEVPNLRPRAFSFLKRTLKRWLLAITEPSVGPEPTGREKRIYWRYGIASFVFSAGLLAVMISRIGAWLIENYQMWGILLISAVGVLSVQTASRETFRAQGRFLGALAARLGKAPRFLLILAIAGGGSFLPWELKIPGDFTIRSQEQLVIGAQVDGTLKAINVDEGSPVHRGDVLAVIENLQLVNDFEETKGELASKRAVLKLLNAGARPEELDRARRNIDTKETELVNAARVEEVEKLLQERVAKKEAELRNAKETYQRSQKLYDGELISRNDLDRDSTLYEVRTKELSESQRELQVLKENTDRTLQIKRKELEASQSELNLLKAGTRKESIEAAAADVKKLEERLSILGRQLELLKLRSPIEGVVTTPYLKNKLGDYIEKGDAFCEIVNLGVVVIDMPIPEKEIADVQLGYPITLKVRGFPSDSFESRVTTIAPVAVESGPDRKVLIKSELDNREGKLKVGMTGVGKIRCGKRTIAYLLTRRLVRWLRTEFWEYLP
jgi:putative peptide zinc metalloprotease protein